jgi:hypothetical protein
VVGEETGRAAQACGTTFSWMTRARGTWSGWIGGWALCVTDILVVGSLADVAARYTYLFFQSMVDLADPGAFYTGGSILGLGVLLVIGLGLLLLGAILMVLWRLGGHQSFFGRRRVVASEVAVGRVTVHQTTGAPPEEGSMGSVVLGFDCSPSARVALSVGERPFKRAILGSTPHKLLHVSEVPVLCAPAESAGSR